MPQQFYSSPDITTSDDTLLSTIMLAFTTGGAWLLRIASSDGSDKRAAFSAGERMLRSSASNWSPKISSHLCWSRSSGFDSNFLVGGDFLERGVFSDDDEGRVESKSLVTSGRDPVGRGTLVGTTTGSDSVKADRGSCCSTEDCCRTVTVDWITAGGSAADVVATTPVWPTAEIDLMDDDETGRWPSGSLLAAETILFDQRTCESGRVDW